jgi:hypothetical protein
LTKLLMGKKSSFSTDMPTHGFIDGNGDPIRTEDGEIDWGAGEELLTAEMKAEAFRIFAAPKFAKTERESERPEMPDLRSPCPQPGRSPQ